MWGVLTDGIMSEVVRLEPVAAKDHEESVDEAPVRQSLGSDDRTECRQFLFQFRSIPEIEAFRYILSLEQKVLAFAFKDKRQASVADFFTQ